MRILVFGASGFIGAHLTRYCALQGHEVIAFCRSGRVPGFEGACIRWTLEQLPSETNIQGGGLAIHLAHDFNGPGGAEMTRRQTLALAGQLRACGVQRQIYFSSYSAGPHAKSIYGTTKWSLDEAFSKTDDVVVIRPGLVLGDGGIYGRVKNWAETFPLVPLPDGGRGSMPVISVEKLCEHTLRAGLAAHPLQSLNLFEREMVSLRQLVVDAAAAKGKRPVIVPIPSSLLLVVLRVAKWLHLPMPVNEDNLRGFLSNQSAGHISSL